MNRKLLLSFLIGVAPVAALAQGGVVYGPQAGDKELTLSGTGSSESSMDKAKFGVNAGYGWFYTDELELGVRQSLNYVDQPNTSSNTLNGSTTGFVDYNFTFLRHSDSAMKRAVPFLGAGLGGAYGKGVKDSALGGLEAGLKYYVRPKTFILTAVQYQYFFTNFNDIDNGFKDGAFVYTLGLGYHF